MLFRLQVGLEDRLQDQHSSHLHHAIFYARNSQRSELAITFRDEHASDRSGTIRSVLEFLRQFVQPPISAVRLDVRKALAVDPRCPAIFAAADESPLQNAAAFPIYTQGRRPHWTFRGLLNVHWRLRPVGSLSRQSDPSVSKAPTVSFPPRVASIATGWSDPVAGWDLHPLKI